MKRYKLIESFFITSDSRNTWKVIFNCKDKNCFVHQYNDTEYLVSSFDGEKEVEERIEIPDFLPPLENGIFSVYKSTDKWQHVFLYYPHYEYDLEIKFRFNESGDTMQSRKIPLYPMKMHAVQNVEVKAFVSLRKRLNTVAHLVSKNFLLRMG